MRPGLAGRVGLLAHSGPLGDRAVVQAVDHPQRTHAPQALPIPWPAIAGRAASSFKCPRPAPVTLRPEVLHALNVLVVRVILGPRQRQGVLGELPLGHDITHRVEEPVAGHTPRLGGMKSDLRGPVCP
jgi:hypothetical protein